VHEVGLSARSTSPTQIQMARTPDAEIALIERVCSGETQLFYELISPYERRVYVAAVSVLQNEADAEKRHRRRFSRPLYTCIPSGEMPSSARGSSR